MKHYLEVISIQTRATCLVSYRFLLTHQHVVCPAGQMWRVHGALALGARRVRIGTR